MKIKKIIAAGLSVIILSASVFNANISVHAADLNEDSTNRRNMTAAVCGEVKSGMDDTIETVRKNVKLDYNKAVALPMTLADDETRIYSGYLTEDEEIAYIVESLQPGEILNVSLICPLSSSLDYDLLLCECDPDTFEVGETLDFSTLTTHYNTHLSGINKTADESISYINNSNEVKYYYIIVFSKQGYSTIYNFNLNVSVSPAGSYDAEEPNDSVYHPTTVSLYTTGDLNLHSENDNDWFQFTAVEDVQSITLDIGDIGYETEVYLTNGSALFLEYPNKYGEYDLTPGYTYFIHVYSSMSDFISSKYNLKIIPNGIEIGKIEVIDFTGDMGSDKATYRQGTLYQFDKSFTITVKVTTKNGYAVANQKVDLTWESGSWSEASGNRSKSTYAITDNNGIAKITLSSLPDAMGTYSYTLGNAVTFIHYYDYDSILFSVDNYYGRMRVYHFAYSKYV